MLQFSPFAFHANSACALPFICKLHSVHQCSRSLHLFTSAPRLSSASDSSTDSSKGSSGGARPKHRGGFGKPPSKVTYTVTEAAKDDESGSSSGVDTDSVPIVSHEDRGEGLPSGISANIVQVLRASCRGPTLVANIPTFVTTSASPSSCAGPSNVYHNKTGQRSRGRQQRDSSELDNSDIEIDIDECAELPSVTSSHFSAGTSSSSANEVEGFVETAACEARAKEQEDRRRGAVDRTPEKTQGQGRTLQASQDDGYLVRQSVAAAGAMPAVVPCPQSLVTEGAHSNEHASLEENKQKETSPSEVPSDESGPGASASGGAEDTDSNSARHKWRVVRTRERRRKRGPTRSAVNQATEAEAHFMFELAKSVLTKAGGNSNTSVFSHPTSSTSQSGPHRALQMCAFEIGLFALGLHNRTSPNWLSRTYSSHVSWISGQAMEIGSQAITLLLKHWNSNLTPSEVASIADRASRSNDPAMVRAAAELGLSSLHMAHTLNPGEILRALLQCREEDSQLLEQACQAVENAAHGGGVYPEVLFEVAKHWFYLHEQSQAGSSSRVGKGDSRNRSPARTSQPVSHPPTTLPQMPFTLPLYSSLPLPLYTPEQYVQQQMHQQVHQMMNQYQGHHPGGAAYRSGSQAHYSYPYGRPLAGAYAGLPSPHQVTSAGCLPGPQHSLRVTTQQQTAQVPRFLSSAYRVGMLALESLARRTPDDRPSIKFSKNPPCGEDLRWLCTISSKLGPSNLQRFCVSALNAVVSPFLLHDLALEAARLLARSNPTQLAANLRSPHISPLVQKSLVTYGQCIHFNLINIGQSEYEDFVELLRRARSAFCMAPGGMTQFNDLLQGIRKRYPKKKELWQMIMTGLAKA